MLTLSCMETAKTKQMGYRAHPKVMAAFKRRVNELAAMMGGPEAGDALSESKTVEMFMIHLAELPLMESIRHIKAIRASFRAWTDRMEEEALEARAGMGRGGEQPAGGVVLDVPLKPKESPQSSSSRPPGHGKPRGHR